MLLQAIQVLQSIEPVQLFDAQQQLRPSEFLERVYWGNGYNTEVKELILKHAFGIVDCVRFRVGEANVMSRRAVEKLGATILSSEENYSSSGGVNVSVVYEFRKKDWLLRLNQRGVRFPWG